MTKEEAIQKGKDLAARLGPGWKSKTWDNLGSHYDVMFDNLVCISEYEESGKKSYTCLISGTNPGAGDYFFINKCSGISVGSQHFNTPEKALEHSLNVAADNINYYTNLILRASRGLEKDKIKQKALAKLTADEREALNV